MPGTFQEELAKSEDAQRSPTGMVVIDYTNHRGERRKWRILPQSLLWHPEGVDRPANWHKGPQWVLWAVDLENERKQIKGFAMSGIHSWVAFEPTEQGGD